MVVTALIPSVTVTFFSRYRYCLLTWKSFRRDSLNPFFFNWATICVKLKMCTRYQFEKNALNNFTHREVGIIYMLQAYRCVKWYINVKASHNHTIYRKINYSIILHWGYKKIYIAYNKLMLNNVAVALWTSCVSNILLQVEFFLCLLFLYSFCLFSLSVIISGFP